MSTVEEIVIEATKARETKQYELAVELFGEACGTFAAAHDGQEDPDLLFQYGTALFELGRANATLLNTENVDNTSKPAEMQDMDELEVVPEGEKTSKQLAAEQKAELEAKAKAEAESAEAEAKEAADNSEKPEEADGSASAASAAAAEPEVAAEEEEVDDFTAAWQMIDLCRVLYTRELEITKEKSKIEQKLAKVYSLLGEISIEDDNYEQAAIDFKSALEIKQKLLDPNDRLLSEAHYMLALAIEMKGDAIDDKKEALANMQSAVDIAKKAGVDHQSIQDLRQKVHDLKKEIDAIAATPSSSSSAAPVDREAALKGMMDMLGGAQDIGGLVKRKLEPKKKEVKKVKLDE